MDLETLLEENPELSFTDLRALRSGGAITQNQFVSLMFDLGSLRLYENNKAVFDTIPAAALKNPFQLIDDLREVRPKIQNRATKNHSLGYLVRALVMGGKIPSEQEKALTFAVNAAEYFDSNPLLQTIPEVALANSFSLVSYLRAHRSSMTSPSDKDHNSLGYLVQALVMGGKIPREQEKELVFSVNAAEYFDSNPLLQTIPEVALADSFSLVSYLRVHRSSMTSPSDKDHNSLGYLVQALVMGGKIPREQEKTLRFAVSAAEYFDSNPLLQTIPEVALADSFSLVSYLRVHRSSMTSPSDKDHNSLGYLVRALVMGGKIPREQEKELVFSVNAAEYFDSNPLLQTIPEVALADNFSLVSYLRVHRSSMTSPEGKEYNSLSYLVQALVMGGKIPREQEKTLRFAVNAAEYFDSNPLLQTIPEVALADNFSLVSYLRVHRSSMTSPEGKDHNSLGYLVQALVMGGKIPSEREKALLFAASAAEYFDSNPLLQTIPEVALADNFSLVGYLQENRSSMTSPEGKDHNSLGYLVRALVMGGKIPSEREKALLFAASAAEYFDSNPLLQTIPEVALADNFSLVGYLQENRSSMTSPSDRDHNSLSYLICALVMGGKIPREQEKALTFDVGAADYAFKRQEMITQQIMQSYEGLTQEEKNSRIVNSSIKRGMDREKFTWLNNGNKLIGDRYFRDIMKFAFAFYGNEAIGAKTQ